jgi:hypothetical protein
MSAEYRCDRCGEKLKANEGRRLKVKLGKFSVEIMHANDGTWNAGDICHKCVRDVVAKGKPIR